MPTPQPTQNMRQRTEAPDVRAEPSTWSAIATMPCAPTGAMGKGRSSTSDVTRKSP